MMDRVELFVPDGGPRGLGFVRGIKAIDPAEWFFQAHFYQDPVWPGSLGLEAFIQLLKVAAARRWGTPAASQSPALGATHRWTYRGQVIPTDRLVTVQAVVTAVDDAARTLTADGFLSVDGRAIYQMNDFTLQAGTEGGLP
jgi:3-hydroxymyristoyl/3-hydroxydecanoyl-(acyl carrier protein) dehydratase